MSEQITNVLEVFCIVCVNLEEWAVSVTTGVYEPEEEEDDENENEDDTEDKNTNNNADGVSTSGAEKSRSAKYKEPPNRPTCGIVVVLYGDKGKTGILPLLSSNPDGTSKFEPGVADEFKVKQFVAHSTILIALKVLLATHVNLIVESKCQCFLCWTICSLVFHSLNDVRAQ